MTWLKFYEPSVAWPDGLLLDTQADVRLVLFPSQHQLQEAGN